MIEKLSKILEQGKKPIIVIYFLLFALYVFSRTSGGGDEALFINDLKLIQTQGWIAAIKKSISIPYMLLAYPLSFLFTNIIALRLTNIALLGLLFLYFRRKKITPDFYWLLLFFIPAADYFLKGTNDAVFFIGLIIFFYEVYLLTIDKESEITLGVLGLVLCFFTRELFLVFMPAIFLGFLVIYRKGQLKSIKLKYVVPLIGVFLLFNIPSLEANHKLSYDFKSPPKEGQATWAQLQYLAQLMVNEGKLENHSHPSWDTTEKYLKEHGPNSLPKGILDGLFFDFGLTVKEFFKDFGEVCFYGFRQMSLMFYFPFLALFLIFKNKKATWENCFLPLVFFMVISIFSFIIISYVELRWLSPVFILAIAYYSDRDLGNEFIKKYSFLNTLLLITICFYGSFKLINKLV
ncbi:hypothetical protein LZZ90_07025 [Flavobacterium sp. SM15]|uniref:hypothetical protein n=1 Tax=Flavobacterium sp. SM15 TaxID=2908005 RepID=UPI001EDAD14F|nr:hypothetical protein [Flavobacterium sp. SM15]MCG2611254.1 hypothetical protein [Flavobacterium sp. SM15]